MPQKEEDDILDGHDDVEDADAVPRVALLQVEETEDVDGANDAVEEALFKPRVAEVRLLKEYPENHDEPVDTYELKNKVQSQSCSCGVQYVAWWSPPPRIL